MEALKKKIVVKRNNGKFAVESGRISVPDIPAARGVINGNLKIDDEDDINIEFRGDDVREELYFLRKPNYFFLLAKKEEAPYTQLIITGDELKVGSHQIGWEPHEVKAEFLRDGSTGEHQMESRGLLTVLSITEQGELDVIEGHFSFNYIDINQEKPRDVVVSCPLFRLRVLRLKGLETRDQA
ncbi:hypothetical protein Q8X48_07730 [Pseudomonas sp. QLc11A]|jgi:hypothetical protein|uniref:Uncharacterized protein n=1 Tax=Pseudomonas azerbaijanorientalis TaxID=2842350 RepID=A0ABW8W9F7_9PSED